MTRNGPDCRVDRSGRASDAVRARSRRRRAKSDPIRMLSILMGLSVIKAALIIAYFMHLKFEVSPMKWVTMSSLVFCLAMMLVFLPDPFRILHLGVK